MTKQDSGGRSIRGVSRRSLVLSAAASLSLPFVAKTTTALAQERLAGTGEVVVFSYGGSFTEGARRKVFDPFTKATGIKVVDVVADLAEPQIKAMNRAGRMDWDIAYVTGQNFPAMHEAGMFVPIDYSFWDQESLDGTPPQNRREDTVALFQTATVLAYDQRVFPKDGPKNWADFWDVKKFSGPRGLWATWGKHNILFALLAEGVAHKDIWPLTDDKIGRAFKKLNEIKPYITKWWVGGGESTQLLINREYAMTSANDGRVISAINQGAPIKLVWDDAFMGYQYAVILRGGPNTANAQKLIAFVNRAQVAAAWTQGTGYPGSNVHQLKYLPANLAPLVSVNPNNASKCILDDPAWLAEMRPDGKTNADHIQERWLAWRAQ